MTIQLEMDPRTVEQAMLILKNDPCQWLAWDERTRSAVKAELNRKETVQ